MTVILLVLLACGGAPEARSGDATAPAASAGSEATAPSANLDVTALRSAMESTALPVLDVRSPEEFADGHVPGAINIPLQELQTRMGELETLKDREFAVICAVGGRSSSATSMLHRKGFTGARNVDGGTNAWKAAGYPLE